MNPEPTKHEEGPETCPAQGAQKASADVLKPTLPSRDPATTGGVAYIPRPGSSNSTGSSKPRNWWWLMGACAACAVGVALGLALLRNPSPPTTYLPRQVQHGSVLQKDKILFVSDRDLDKEATENARAALQRGEIAPPLAKASEQTRKGVLSGDSALFKLHILDTVEEDGDAVMVYLDGIPYGEIILSHAGADLTVALKRGSTAQLRIVAARDAGGGGVTFGASSSLGEMRTRVMNVGESEDWLISCK